LHHENIIVRPLRTEATIVYDINGVTHNHRTRNIATFIDYGFSHAVYQGYHYGRYDFRGFSVLPEQSYTIFDAFKLLCFCLEEAARSNPSLLPTLTDILRFFINDSYQTLLGSFGPSSGYFYSIPYQLGSTVTLDGLIRHLIGMGAPFISATPQTQVLRCNMAGTCLDSDTLSQFMGLNTKNGDDIQSINGYLIAQRYGRVSSADKERFRKLFSAQLYSNAYRHIKNQTIAITEILQQTKPVIMFSNSKMAKRNLHNPKNREFYRNYVNTTVDLVAKYNDLIGLYTNLASVLESLAYDPLEVINQREMAIKGFHHRISRLTNSINADIKFINSLVATGYQYPEAQWFTSVLPNYTSALILHDA